VLETTRQLGNLQATFDAEEGARLKSGQVIGRIFGSGPAVLSAERTSLNFLSHLSGVATLAARYVEAVASVNPSCKVLDTRKTTPGLRALEKAAVRAGGGTNHRGSLSEGILLKDNHLAGAPMAELVSRALERWPGRLVEVECERLDQVAAAVEAGASMVLCDNMSTDELADCVAYVRSCPGRVLVEASGGITLETIAEYAAAGPDFISVGAITHSAPALDIGLDIAGPGGRADRGGSLPV
jgi:nicotinate-nucleotide pyrophosphorylase (carboxylating)